MFAIDKLDVILERLNSLQRIEADIQELKNSQDKMLSDITAFRADNKAIYKKLDVITETIANMQEDVIAIKQDITDNSLKIKIIDNKVKAL